MKKAIAKKVASCFVMIGLAVSSNIAFANPLTDFVRCSSVTVEVTRSEVNDDTVRKLENDLSNICDRIEKSNFVSDKDFIISFTNVGSVLNRYKRIKNNLNARAFVTRKLRYLLSKKAALCKKILSLIHETSSVDTDIFSPISGFLGEEQFMNIVKTVANLKGFIFSDFIVNESPLIDFGASKFKNKLDSKDDFHIINSGNMSFKCLPCKKIPCK